METLPSHDKARYIAVPPEDYIAIADALHRFGAGQDLRDRSLLESAFSAEATLDFTAVAARLGVTIPAFQGRQAIADAILTTIARLDTTHSIANVRITTFNGARADVTALIEAQHLPRGNHSRHLLLKNALTVELVREDGRWVIDRMKFDNVWRTGDPSVLFPAPAA
jgi:hypothetical protein